MKKLLVPIDFSAAARYGFEYAEWLTVADSNDLLAVHVAANLPSGETLEDPHVQQLKTEQKGAILAHLKRFTTPYPDHDEEAFTRIQNLRCEIRHGQVVSEILALAKEEEVDMIVIGTRRKHTLWDHLFGSVTTQLLVQSSIPVLVIPEGCAFKPIKKVAFANAITGEENATISYLEKLAKHWRADLQQVFVNTLPHDFLHNKQEVWELPNQELGTQTVNMIRENKLEDGLELFTAQQDIDLIAMMAPHRDRLQRFWHRHKRNAMAYHTQLPLLVIPATSNN
ncbi:MAG: universal stress protein [Saprospiraceae bacterium]|nr:universal stress protein [Saprospiraceae bacterium]